MRQSVAAWHTLLLELYNLSLDSRKSLKESSCGDLNTGCQDSILLCAVLDHAVSSCPTASTILYFRISCPQKMLHNHSIAQGPPLASCISQKHQQSHVLPPQGTACLHSGLNLRTQQSLVPLSLSIHPALDLCLFITQASPPPTVTATSNAGSSKPAILQKLLAYG